VQVPGHRARDFGPCNTVYCGGIPVAFIGWDSAGAVGPLADLAVATWIFVPRMPPEQRNS
jgi:hypothetical protein